MQSEGGIWYPEQQPLTATSKYWVLGRDGNLVFYRGYISLILFRVYKRGL